MRPTPTYTNAAELRPSPLDRAQWAAAGTRDWLDARGRWAWLAAIFVTFVAAWPLGLGLLAYTIWSKRMFGHSTNRPHGMHGCCGTRRAGGMASTGNTAFDAYRAETLRRLEDEHQEFLGFLARLREAKDKAEFDQFMAQRDSRPTAE